MSRPPLTKGGRADIPSSAAGMFERVPSSPYQGGARGGSRVSPTQPFIALLMKERPGSTASSDESAMASPPVPPIPPPRRRLSLEQCVEGVLGRQRGVLSRVITLIEPPRPTIATSLARCAHRTCCRTPAGL